MRNFLKLMHRTRAAQEAPIEYGKGDTSESRDLVHKVAADLIVLLKNERNILPLAKDATTKYGLIGEHFENPATCGGGSSESAPFYILTPIDAITEVIGTQNAYYKPGYYCKSWFVVEILFRATLTFFQLSDECR